MQPELWSQTLEAVTVSVPVAATRKHELKVRLAASNVRVAREGEDAPLLEGELFEPIVLDESYWTFNRDGGATQHVQLTLEKAAPAYWPFLFKPTAEEAASADGRFERGVYHESRGQYAEALVLYEQAAEQGNVRAQMKLAAVHEAGLEGPFRVRGDPARSFAYHLQAAERDNAEACFFAANSLQFAHGAARNYKDAARWYQRALELDARDKSLQKLGFKATALYNLGLLFHDGGDGLAADVNQCIMHWNSAQMLGSAQAAYNLGLLFARGQLVPQSLASAREYFDRAASLDDRLRPPPAITALFASPTRATPSKPRKRRSAPPTPPASPPPRPAASTLPGTLVAGVGLAALAVVVVSVLWLRAAR